MLCLPDVQQAAETADCSAYASEWTHSEQARRQLLPELRAGDQVGGITMAVIRVEKTKDYIVMSNSHLRSKSLSLKAKGLLSIMLSLPDDWDYTVAGLATLSADGLDSVRNALKELKKDIAKGLNNRELAEKYKCSCGIIATRKTQIKKGMV